MIIHNNLIYGNLYRAKMDEYAKKLKLPKGHKVYRNYQKLKDYARCAYGDTTYFCKALKDMAFFGDSFHEFDSMERGKAGQCYPVRQHGEKSLAQNGRLSATFRRN